MIQTFTRSCIGMTVDGKNTDFSPMQWELRAPVPQPPTMKGTECGEPPRNPFFSKQKILSLEPVIQGQIEKLPNRVEDFAASGKVLVIGVAYAALTIDVVTEYAMEKSIGNLDRKDFNRDMVECARGFGLMWRIGKHITWLPPLMEVAPDWLMEREPKIGQWIAFRQVC